MDWNDLLVKAVQQPEFIYDQVSFKYQVEANTGFNGDDDRMETMVQTAPRLTVLKNKWH
jgi:hypothetical protein